jgi:hypothetical protein
MTISHAVPLEEEGILTLLRRWIFTIAVAVAITVAFLDSFMIVGPDFAQAVCGLMGAIACGSLWHAQERHSPAYRSGRRTVSTVITIVVSALGMALGIGFANTATLGRDDHELSLANYRRLADTLVAKPYANRLIAPAREDGVITNGEYDRFRAELSAIDGTLAKRRALGE